VSESQHEILESTRKVLHWTLSLLPVRVQCSYLNAEPFGGRTEEELDTVGVFCYPSVAKKIA
jgi:hypothetical protein